ncbi:MAG TPA: biotin/lipoyl-binding protein, partial [Pseudomonas sp.]|nr:biotin/lipoyl-binding protein [Pseudomonas sp.]
MDLLLILTYTAICVAIFKVFRIPLNKWTVPTAVLGGIVLIGSLIFLMNYNHPYSEVSRSYFVSTPIVPAVSGQVIEVPAQGNRLMEKGDVLFRIDPTPFENRVKSIRAQLVSARADLSRASELARRNVGNRRDVDITAARVEDLQAQLNIAQFELDNTTVRAPSKGYVTQVSLRPGIYAVKMPLRPAMIFIPHEDYSYVAWMRQNSQLRLTLGDEAEIAFDGIPGEVFAARVKMVMPVIAEGQVQPSGHLIGFTGSPP